jgi:hypothetical protein
VILDADLASLYGVSTKRLNEQVKRNAGRFPGDFTFLLTREEKLEVVANCDHLRALRFSHTAPRAFTEHGALMAANVLNSESAVQMSVFVIRAFMKMRERLELTTSLERRLSAIENTLIGHDKALHDLYRKIKPLLLAGLSDKPKRQIGFTARD